MQLPPAREVVASLAINPNTVFKAYAELEHEGLVTSRQGLGTFIAMTAPNPIDDRLQRKLRRTLDAWLRSAREAGIEREAAVGMFMQGIDASYGARVA
jgi:GntR family transcriptional regulator